MQGAAGGGLFLRTPGISLTRNGAGPYFGLLGQVEAGYALATSSDFAMHASSTSAANNPIPTPAVPLGHVGRSSPYLRVLPGPGFLAAAGELRAPQARVAGGESGAWAPALWRGAGWLLSFVAI